VNDYPHFLQPQDGLSGLLFGGYCDSGFWIADFGFPGNKNFFEESVFIGLTIFNSQ